MTRAITIPKASIDNFCRRWRISELSANRSEIEGDDLGIFVRFDPSAEWSLLDRMNMQSELQALSAHTVQLRDRHQMHGSHRPARSSGRVLYDA